jgi:hypothetical protein
MARDGSHHLGRAPSPTKANGLSRPQRGLDVTLPHTDVPGSSVSRCRAPKNRRAYHLPGTIPTNPFHDTRRIGKSCDLAFGKARFLGVFRRVPPPHGDVLSERFLRYSLRYKGVTPMGAFGMTIVEGADVGPVRRGHGDCDKPLTPDCIRVLRPPGLSNGEHDFASGSLDHP